jgi:hypothetical protein
MNNNFPLTKESLLKNRKEFFENILKEISKKPGKIDSLLKQEQYFFEIDDEDTFYDETTGDLIITTKGTFFNKPFTTLYSFWQIGDTLKIGVTILNAELSLAITSDQHNEIYTVWGDKVVPEMELLQAGLRFFTWSFNCPDLYLDYKQQEKFILGARHMHFRIMRIISDECQRLSKA